MSVGGEGKLPEWATKIHQEYGEPKLSELQDVFLGSFSWENIRIKKRRSSRNINRFKSTSKNPIHTLEEC